MIIPLDSSCWDCDRPSNRTPPFKIKSNFEFDYLSTNPLFVFITDQDLEIIIRVLSQELHPCGTDWMLGDYPFVLQLLPRWRTIGINEQKIISLGSELKKIGVWGEEWSSPLGPDCDCFLTPDSVLEAIKFIINSPMGLI